MSIQISQILYTYILNKQKLINKKNCANDGVINRLLSSKIQKNIDLLRVKSELIKNSLKVIQDYEVLKKNSGVGFNLLKMFYIGETQHSYLLANLLNKDGSHGQGHLFLNAFLDKIGITRERNDENWIVTAETGRIDILLRRVYPHSVVIVENKSNYAVDQENQLYRYWYQEIYRRISERHLPAYYIEEPPEVFYQIIYLSPNSMKFPKTNSLSKPSNWDKTLPPIVPIKIKTLTFSKFIGDWLTDCLQDIPLTNYRVREYVKQYIEYWN